MPTSSIGSFSFSFTPVSSGFTFVDPLVAVGYVYTISSGQTFNSVLLPSAGDDIFAVSVWNGSTYVADGAATASVAHNFGSGVGQFRVTGIELSAGLDPANTSAFMTGLTFNGGGTVFMTQTPITASVPEPSAYALMLLGTGAIALGARRRRSAAGLAPAF